MATLSQLPGQGAWIGNPLGLLLSNLPANQPAFMFLGFSKTSWGSLPLPLSLALLGMRGCSLYTSITTVFSVANIGGQGIWSLPIPMDIGLVGGTFYTQSLVFDLGANPAGATTTNAGKLTIGLK